MAIAAVGFLVAAWLAFHPALFNDGDTGWHLAAGRWILEHGSVPARDPFSHTFKGQAWVAHEWLADLFMALLFRVGSWGALALPFALAIGAVLFLAGREALRALPLRYAIAAVSGLIAILAPAMLARPHVLAWLLLTLWLLILVRAREAGRAPPFSAAALMLIWANLHASYIVGLSIAAGLALEALIEEHDRRRTILGWGAFGLLALGAASVTPHGIAGFLYPFQVSGMRILPIIEEWRPTQLPKDAPFALFALASLGIGALYWRRVGPVRLAMTAGLAWMAVEHSRHQPLFALVSILALLPRTLQPQQAPAALRGKALLLLLGGVAALVLARVAVPYHRSDAVNYPVSAIAWLPPVLRASPVLNSYSFGGPLALHGIGPFIDGRSDMYGDDFTILHNEIMSGDMAAFRLAERRWKLGWTMLHPSEPLVERLDREPGWRRVYADRWAVIHLRQ